ncbi:MAG: hypothetical protein HYU69_00200 [Bacteroidetes bacterium]|nr:hypothetical protein [Bacteroidota bacterium]
MNHFLTSRATRVSTILIALTTTNNLLTTSCNGQQVKTNSSKDSVVATQTVTAGQPRMSRGLLQDKNGNFWLCNGRNGVTVYNGKFFTHYTEKDGLSNNQVGTVLEDNTGKLWFGTADGITCYDGKKFTVIPVTTITGNTNYHKTVTDPTYGISKPMENFVLSILQDRTGMLWFGTPAGIYQHDPSKDQVTGSKTFSPFSYNDSIAIQNGALGVESIIEDSSGNIWFGGRGIAGVHCYNGKSLTRFTPNGENWVSPMLQDKSGNIWFSKRTQGPFSYDGKTLI